MSNIADKLLCSIYRSERKTGAYLYTAFNLENKELDVLPNELKIQLGDLTEVMKLVLTPERKLANANAEKVMQNIRDSGYYLQMPPGNNTLAGKLVEK